VEQRVLQRHRRWQRGLQNQKTKAEEWRRVKFLNLTERRVELRANARQAQQELQETQHEQEAQHKLQEAQQEQERLQE
jgi:hypothetical protein